MRRAGEERRRATSPLAVQTYNYRTEELLMYVPFSPTSPRVLLRPVCRPRPRWLAFAEIAGLRHHRCGRWRSKHAARTSGRYIHARARARTHSSAAMPRRGNDSRSFRFELMPNGTAASPDPSAQGGGGGNSCSSNSKGKKRNGNSRRGSSGGRSDRGIVILDAEPASASWNSVDVDSICSLVPQLDRQLAVEICEEERRKGSSVEAAIDALFALSLTCVEPSASASTAADDAGGSVRTNPAGSAAPAISDEAIGATTSGMAAVEPPLLAQLPDELLAMLFAHFDFGYRVLGTLGLVCKDWRDLTRRWLGSQVRCLRFTGALRSWGDARILGLVRATSGSLETLTIHAPRSGSEGVSALSVGSAGRQLLSARSNSSSSTSGVGVGVAPRAAALSALFHAVAAPSCRLLSLHLESHPGFDEVAAGVLVASCPLLTTLSLSSCPNLTDRAALELLRLPALEDLRLRGHPQLSARASELLASQAPALTRLDLSHAGQGVFDAQPLRASPSARRHPSSEGRHGGGGSCGSEGSGGSDFCTSSGRHKLRAGASPMIVTVERVPRATCSDDDSQTVDVSNVAGGDLLPSPASPRSPPSCAASATALTAASSPSLVDVEALLASPAVATPLGWEHVRMPRLLMITTGARFDASTRWTNAQARCASRQRLRAAHVHLVAPTQLNASSCAPAHGEATGEPTTGALKLASCKAFDTLVASERAPCHTHAFGCRALGGGTLEACSGCAALARPQRSRRH